ncbi:hypothetical protein [Lignipirellula cremea]|uniref:Uncharacterized protein n=1 Tax=Lignipirellula cremea TaxID=2528010 RepID=A0A518DRT7_9BACT|nr:hypothetical protein [Lignipirellula cremea]QDU94546.1 hypothetical protein Pla8534_23370 [Lignipirellula cremea]
MTASFPSSLPAPLKVSFPCRAVLDLPGENDERRRAFDWVVRTQFLGIEDPASRVREAACPFLLAASATPIFLAPGVIQLQYRKLCCDPGYDCGLKECQALDALMSMQSAADFAAAVGQHALLAGDALPVFVQTDAAKLFGVLHLGQRQDERTFACQITTLRELPPGRYTVTRELDVRLLDLDSGELAPHHDRKVLGVVEIR